MPIVNNNYFAMSLNANGEIDFNAVAFIPGVTPSVPYTSDGPGEKQTPGVSYDYYEDGKVRGCKNYVAFNDVRGGEREEYGVAPILDVLESEISSKGKVVNNHGVYVAYDRNGVVTSATMFDAMGRKDGKERLYYPDGTVKAKLNYDHGVLDGRQRTFYSDGSRHLECDMSDGKFSGEQSEYWPNDAPKTTAVYDKGVLNGYCATYDIRGVQTSSSKYENGIETYFFVNNKYRYEHPDLPAFRPAPYEKEMFDGEIKPTLLPYNPTEIDRDQRVGFPDPIELSSSASDMASDIFDKLSSQAQDTGRGMSR